MTIEELIEDIDLLLADNLPEGKTVDDFTGGYVQQLANSTKFVAYFGTKVGSNNKATSSIAIENNELDIMYMMLKAKIHDMRNKKSKVKTVSLASRRLAKKANALQPKENIDSIDIDENASPFGN